VTETEYSFRVKARNGDGVETIWSETDLATLKSIEEDAENEELSPPTNLTLMAAKNADNTGEDEIIENQEDVQIPAAAIEDAASSAELDDTAMRISEDIVVEEQGQEDVARKDEIAAPEAELKEAELKILAEGLFTNAATLFSSLS